MNAAMEMYEEQETSYASNNRPSLTSGARPARTNTNRANFGRRGKAPKSYNGMHRRRQKKIRW